MSFWKLFNIFHKSVQALITDVSVPPWNKLRLVILYALRYQKTQTSNIVSLINLMLSNGVSREDAQVRRLPNATSLIDILASISSWYMCS
jgi:hypothetical protein